jgi:mannose-1-phosphate guanylyltransferase
MNYGVILAGGKGERFWPLSTREHPKQLLKLTSGKSMLQETIDRLAGFISPEKILVVTGSELEERILDDIKSLTAKNLLLEPQGKNTCLALAFASLHIYCKDPDGIMVVLSSDHLIQQKEQLIRILDASARLASQNSKLITIGIVPSRAETGYGYIEMGPKVTEIGGIKFYDVVRFKEKPERPKAQEYYLDRKHLWNSGMFVWSVKTFLRALEKHMPEMYSCLQEYKTSLGSSTNVEAVKHLYQRCENISVDFAIFEKADNVLCVKGDIRWDDVGSWLALQRIHAPNRDGNVILGEVVLESSFENTVVNDREEGLIVGFGVSDLIIVQTGKIVMVAHKTRANDIKELLSKFEENERYQQYL